MFLVLAVSIGYSIHVFNFSEGIFSELASVARQFIMPLNTPDGPYFSRR
jgi:hypothetical protein